MSSTTFKCSVFLCTNISPCNGFKTVPLLSLNAFNLPSTTVCVFPLAWRRCLSNVFPVLKSMLHEGVLSLAASEVSAHFAKYCPAVFYPLKFIIPSAWEAPCLAKYHSVWKFFEMWLGCLFMYFRQIWRQALRQWPTCTVLSRVNTRFF